MFKVTGSTAMPGALSLVSITVFAAAEDEPNSTTLNSTTLNRDELSLYGAPRQKLRYVEPEAGWLEQSVATLRRTVEPYSAWCRGVYGKVEPKVGRLVQFGNESYAFLKNPPADFYPRAGVIGFAGVLGLFLSRGSRLKRLIYPAGLMAVGASLYYPEEATTVARSAGDTVYDWALKGYVALDKMVKTAGKPSADERPPQDKEK